MATKKIGDNLWFSSSFETEQEASMYHDIKEYLQGLGLLDYVSKNLLSRYCKLVCKHQELSKQNPSHYMVDKYLSHISKLEGSLCLTPIARQNYFKNKTLIKKNIQKINKEK